MAEAAVEDRPLRFFCHVCNVEVQSVSSEYTCPLCYGGFIEELPAAAATTSTDQSMTNDIEMEDLDFLATLTSFLSRDGARPPDQVNIDDENSQNFYVGGRAFSGNGSNNESGNGVAGNTNTSDTLTWTRHGRGNTTDGAASTGRRRHRGRLHNFERFDNVLLEILHTLSGGNDGALGNASMFFMGNPGDYAWGREGIDTIVTQLLNQMDTTGPPPLPKEKIDEIPNVEITNEQVNIKLQCSVCWEDFKLQEIVRKLPCLHLYHENCIVPWLELHGTCPICRKSLSHESKETGCHSRATSAENINLMNDREHSSGNNSVDSNSAFPLTSIANGIGTYSSNTTNTPGVGARRLHISLPRLSLLGQTDNNRTPGNTYYDLRINIPRNNNNERRNENIRQTATTSDTQARQASTVSPSNSAIEQPNINYSDSSSTSNSNNEKKNSNNSNNSNVSNLSKNTAPIPTNENAGENCDSGQATTSSGVSSSTAVNNAPQTDIYKFDDGQVDYEFD